MSIFADLHWRGLIHQSTDDENLPAWLVAAGRTLYAGFDPTADSLHVGSLMPLMLLRRFQKAGHKPIAVVGGATGMIGDPSGKSEERNLQTTEAIERNLAGIRSQMERLLDFSPGPRQALLLNNHDWTHTWSYLDFLRDVGKNFPVSAMLAKDSVKSRLGRDDGPAQRGEGISYTEFSYMLLQAYDFVYLNEHFGCELQVGGSDQWGNITAGIELGRRMRSVQLYGITAPLLTKSDGTKMGKTESGAVWLSAERTSPYQFYQYWINVEDADAGRCLRMLTELGREEIEDFDRQRAASPEDRLSQRRLAEELTRLIHGDEGLQAAQRATDIFFGAEISDIDDRQLAGIFADVPSATLPRDILTGNGLNIMDAFVQSGLAKTKSDARRTVQQGGAYVNNRRVDSIDHTLTAADLASESTIVLRSGKKKYALLRFAWDVALLFPPQGEWTEREYLDLTGDSNRLVELIDGRIEVLAMPTRSHQLIVRALVNALRAFVEPRRLGEVLFAPLRVHMRGRKFREPDVVFMLSEHEDRAGEEFWEGADLVMEVVSPDPDSRDRDIDEKPLDYSAAGIPEYWIVDPETQRITVLKLIGQRFEVHSEGGRGEQATSALLGGFAVNVAQVFDAARPRR